MKKSLFIILTLILLVSCDRGIKHALPPEYKIRKEKMYTVYPTELRIYNIRGKEINQEKLKDYPNKAIPDCSLQKWIDFNDLNNKDREYMIAVIQEVIEWVGSIDKNGSKELDSIFNDNRNFYFSGHYMEMEGLGSKFNFYENFYFLDLKNKKLYSFQHMRGY